MYIHSPFCFYEYGIIFLYIYIYFADCGSQYIYLNINQLDALNFIMSLFHASTCFEHMCSSSGDQNFDLHFDLLTMSTYAPNM